MKSTEKWRLENMERRQTCIKAQMTENSQMQYHAVAGRSPEHYLQFVRVWR